MSNKDLREIKIRWRAYR